MINAIVITHDGYGLAATLHAIAQASKLPDRIVVTSDGLNANVDRIVEQFSQVFPIPFCYARRQHKGRARRSQARNNGVRALAGLGPEDLLFFLDGHILLGADHFKRLQQISRYDVILSAFHSGDRALSEQLVGAAPGECRPTVRRSPELLVRSLKVTVQKTFRTLDRAWGTALAKAWWPSLCSANFAVKHGIYDSVNGFDEGEIFDDWSPEDSDLGRRLYAAGASICNATVRLGGLHLWHPSNRETRLVELQADMAKYFQGPVVAHQGLRNPRDQAPGEVQVDILRS